MLKKSLVGIALVTLLLSLSLRPALGEDAYRVGFSLAVTGPAAGFSAPIKEAFDVYFKEVNEKGGINGHPVKVIILDHSNQPSKAAAYAKRLVTQDKVILLLNAGLSSTQAPMAQVAKQYNIPFLYAGSVCPPQVFPPNPDSNEFCSTAFAVQIDNLVALPFIKETADPPLKLGFVAQNIPISRKGIELAEQMAGEMGIEVVERVIVPTGAPDYTPFASKLKDAGATYVYAWAPWAVQVKTFEALRRIGWNSPYLLYAHIQAEDELERLKDDKLYAFGTNAFFVDDTPVHQKIKAASKRMGTIYPYRQFTEGWIGAMVLEEILKNTPWPPTPDKVLKAMEALEVDMKGLKGNPIVWTKNNHFRTAATYRFYKWDTKKNKIALVKNWVSAEVK